MADPRDHCLWFGAEPDAEQHDELIRRRIAVRKGDIAKPLAETRDARAVIISLETHEAALLDMIAETAPTFIDHGLRVDIVSPDDAATGRAQQRLAELSAAPGVQLHPAPPTWSLAEAIARHDAGSAPKIDLDIIVPGNREDLRPADRILFQRAFPHCRAITLVELGGGRSDARVFAVHLTVAVSNIGAWPQPAFAKIDRRDKIEREHANYRECAERFIPFGLRPNIETLVIGHGRGLLVGNFVDRSESLWELVRRDFAGQAITALLEETLGGWRDQGYSRDPVKGAVACAMREAGLWNPEQIKQQYVERALVKGIKLTPGDLWSLLSKLDQCYRTAPIHGDLHGENVRVRGASAILIDLASVTTGPLTADLAALETWLAFELPPDAPRDTYFDDEWETVVDRLYAPAAFRHPPGPSRPATPFGWIENVVRQIRTLGIAIQSCPSEYQTAVAVQLLRRCQWADGCAADRGRRATGYRIAAQLVDDLSGDTV